MPTLNIEGRRVTVDDSFMRLSPEQQNATVDEIAGSFRSAEPSPPAAPQERSLVQSAAQLPAGFNEGVATSLARPVDAVLSAAKHSLGFGGANPVEIVHPVENAVRKYTVDPLGPPQSWPEKALRAGGRFAGENMPAVIGLEGAAAIPSLRSGVSEAAPGIVNKARNFTDELLNWISRNPVAAAAGDTAAAVEAGTVGDLSRRSAERAGASPAAADTAETMGQMLGPPALGLWGKYLSPVMAGPRYAMKAVRAGVPMLASVLPEEVTASLPASIRSAADATSDARLAQAKGKVGSEMAKVLAGPEAQANLAETQRLTSEIPGFNPGVARATNDPVLLNWQRDVDLNATNEVLRERQKAADVSEQAIRDYLAGRVPEAGAFPADSTAKTAAERVARIQGQADTQAAGTRSEIQALSDQLPEVDRAGVGETLRTERQGLRDIADEEVSRLRSNIASPDTPIEVGPPPSPGEPALTMTVNEILDRRAEINQTIRRYRSATARTVDDVAAMDRLNAERDRLDRLIEGVNLPGMAEYRSYYRDEYAPNFLEGASRDVGRYDQFGYGKNKVASEDVPGRFFGPNNISEARQFNRLYGGNPTARQAMRDYALDDLRHVALDPNTGRIKQGAVVRWLQKNERILNEMPWIREEVAKFNPDDLYGRLGQVEARKSAVQDTKLATMLSRIEGPGKTTADLFDAALKDHTLMRQLHNSTARGDPAAEGAFRRAVWNHVLERAPDVIDDPAKFLAFIEQNRRSLAVALEPSHLADLEKAAKAAEIQARAPKPIGKAEAEKSLLGKLGEESGVTVQSAAGTGLSLARGRSSPWTEIPMQLIKVFNRNAEVTHRKAIEAALNNPDMARMLSDVFTKKVPPLRFQHMKTHVLTSGLLGLTGEEDNGPEFK